METANLKRGFINFNIIANNDDFLNIEYSYYVYELAICIWKYLINDDKCEQLNIEDIKKLSEEVLETYNCNKICIKVLYWSILFTLSLSLISNHDQKLWVLFDILFFYDITNLE
jgi:hypothetical protein